MTTLAADTPLTGALPSMNVDPAAVRAVGTLLATHAASLHARTAPLPEALAGCRWTGESRDAAQRAAEHKVRDTEEIVEVVTQMKAAIDRYAQMLETARDTALQGQAIYGVAIQIQTTATPADRAAAAVAAATWASTGTAVVATATQSIEQAAIWLASQLEALSARIRQIARTNATDNDRLEAGIMSSSAFFGRTAPGATIRYYDTDAPTLRDEIDHSAKIWNNRLRNIKLVPAPSGEPAQLRYHLEGGPWKAPVSVKPGSIFLRSRKDGTGDILFNREQVQELGLPVVTHETGHFFGLNDNPTDQCGKLMAGETIMNPDGTLCRNPLPDRVEIDQADRYWAPTAPRDAHGLPLAVVEAESDNFHLEDNPADLEPEAEYEADYELSPR
ncbi:MAG: snapalysin family zinc-dependent metalloprotease [Nocardioides sp.]